MIAAVLTLFAAILAALAIARRSHVLARFAELGMLSRRSTRTLARRGVSDWSKERATRILAVRMMAASLSAFAMLLLIAAPVLAALALDPLTSLPTIDAFGDPRARMALLAMGAGLAAIRYTRRIRLRAA